VSGLNELRNAETIPIATTKAAGDGDAGIEFSGVAKLA
jgi:hypothetical protein